MQKRKRNYIISLAVFEVILIVSMVFTVSFILNGGLVNAQENPVATGIQRQFGISEPPLQLVEGPAPLTKTPIPHGSIGVKELIAQKTYQQPETFLMKDAAGNVIPKSDFNQVIIQGDQHLAKPLSGGDPIPLDPAQVEQLREIGNLNTPVGATPYSYKVPLIGTEITSFLLGNLVEGVVWSIAVVGAIQLIGGIAGLDEETTNTASIAAAAGIIGGKAVYGIFGQGGVAGTALPPLGGFAIGAAIAVVVFVLLYKEEEKELVTFECLPFEPPLGGSKCEECNKDPFRPCSEYRCRSLGQACEIVNPGTLEENCVWVNPKDGKTPTISPWVDALKPNGLAYIPDNTIRPPNRGVKIVSKRQDGCLQAFTPLEFGINTDEPAQCKIDLILKNTLEEMDFFFGGTNYFLYNHSQRMKLPGPDDLINNSAPEFKNDGTFSFYVRCQDKNGNENVDAFVINYCVDKSPDTTPPIIEGTSIVDNGFVQFGAGETPIEVYVNEPAECKWSSDSKSYNEMENLMICDTESFQINANLNYACRGNLTGIKDRADNKFYFRCKDQPGKEDSERFEMTQSYELTLKGTQELNILNVGPNGTQFGSTQTVPINLRVRTDDGAEEGKSICYISSTKETDSYVSMGETNSFQHSQSLNLPSGNYEYFFRCIDAGGNTAEDNVTFSVFVDRQAPRVTRAYREEGLKIVTDEDAECVYSLNNCNYVFDEGLPLIYSNPGQRKNHFAEWKANSVYNVKCRDLRENEPSPNECSIVVNSVEI